MRHTACNKTKIPLSFLALCLAGIFTGCSGNEEPSQTTSFQTEPQFGTGSGTQEATGISSESAQDSSVNFEMLQEENPDIFAWLYIPDTGIDCPVLQSGQGDDFYKNHNALGEEDPSGAVYIELANLKSMCDFNTVLHGNADTEQNAPFTQLYRFSDPLFFDSHETIYLYLDGNVLTYEIFAAYERENTSLIRSYDFTYTSGCQEFLDDLYGTREMSMNLREGWDFINPYHFLITLTTQKAESPDRQFVVVAVLTQDAAGTIGRTVAE